MAMWIAPNLTGSPQFAIQLWMTDDKYLVLNCYVVQKSVSKAHSEKTSKQANKQQRTWMGPYKMSECFATQ